MDYLLFIGCLTLFYYKSRGKARNNWKRSKRHETGNRENNKGKVNIFLYLSMKT